MTIEDRFAAAFRAQEALGFQVKDRLLEEPDLPRCTVFWESWAIGLIVVGAWVVALLALFT